MDPEHHQANYQLALANNALRRHAEALQAVQDLRHILLKPAEEGRRAVEDSDVAEWMDILDEVHVDIERRAKDAQGDFFDVPTFSFSGAANERGRKGEGSVELMRSAAAFVGRLQKGEVAPYVGPVKIRRAGGRRGMGLFMTENVEIDTIVLVERALTTLTVDMHEEGDEEARSLFLSAGFMKLIALLKAGALDCPLFNARLLSMWAGDEEEGEGGRKAGRKRSGNDKRIPPMSLFRTDDPAKEEEKERKEGVRECLEKEMVEENRMYGVVYNNALGAHIKNRGPVS